MKVLNIFSKLIWLFFFIVKFFLVRFYNRNGGINFLRKLFRFFMYRSMLGIYIIYWNFFSILRLMYYYDLYYVFFL